MIIYLMAYLPLPIFWKIGFAHTSVMQRAAALDKEVWGMFFPVCWIYIPFAYPLEQAFHRAFKAFNTRILYRGNGSTEIYWLPAAVPVLSFMLVWWMVCFWAAGRMFGFDGIDFYGDFLRGVWQTLVDVWRIFV